ncbi:acyl-CoA dehydrogenase, N-terminal domain protein [Mycobacterium xenopi 4042]|uniref:Acyl-CoA dehydrogenase, N-terminal domain protein n=1 Tax=Mycobacterium xenopi 4042 TaxID=1299334 RepID=X8E5X5_MYCXE|nr:acyl-CoA dehydrogenase, N-terminal domain protein [Mycobacterium xenopi 4042]
MGRLGLNLIQDVELAMELGYTSLALRSMFGTNNGIAGQVLVGFGTEEQKSRWLEQMASGDVVASFALTEPGAGSNPSGLRTKAVRVGDDWIISGQKRFITNAPVADLFVVFARTRPPTTPVRHRRVPGSREHTGRGGRRQRRQDGPGRCVDGRRQLRRRPGSSRRAGGRQCRHRLSSSDDLARARPGTHRCARRGNRAASTRRIGDVRGHRHTGWRTDREFPVGAGDDRRPADRGAGRAGARPRDRSAMGE